MIASPNPDKTPGLLAFFVTLMVALATLTPYVWGIPKDNMQLIIQAQTTLYSGWLLIIGYFFGTSSTSRKNADTIATMAKTAQTAGVALPSVTPLDIIPVEPGETKTVVGTEPTP